MTRRWALPSAVLFLVSVGAGCASASDVASTRALQELTPLTTTTEAAAPSDDDGPSHCDDPEFKPADSFRPLDQLPPPGQMPEGTSMSSIQDAGELRVGVDENTMFFSYRDQGSSTFRGFEPAIARRIGEAIFGPGGGERVRFVPVVTQNKVSAVENDEVDMTVSVVSKSCGRWDDADFSATYYETTQRILVPSDSTIEGMDDLAGQRVCVTSGSSSEGFVEDRTEGIAVPVEVRTDCLVALQERRVDAVLLPFSILAGLHAQDPSSTTILPPEPGLTTQSYGIPIAKGHEDLVRFVNALIEQWRTDGTLAALQEEWLEAPGLRTVPAAPEPTYREP